jgi:hypothetical protein
MNEPPLDFVPGMIAHDPKKWVPVSRLREALGRLIVELDASAREARSEKIMRQQEVKAR